MTAIDYYHFWVWIYPTYAIIQALLVARSEYIGSRLSDNDIISTVIILILFAPIISIYLVFEFISNMIKFLVTVSTGK